MINPMMGKPVPLPDEALKGILGTVVKVIKNLFNIFKTTAKEVGKTDAENSLEKVERVTQIFADFKNQIRSRMMEVEDKVGSEVDYYLEELRSVLSENREKVEKYGIHMKRIERQVNKISSRIKGSIEHELSKTVSLDNASCNAVVTMIPGARKEAAMGEFIEDAAKIAINACCSELRSSLNEVYEDVEFEILGAVESIQRREEQMRASYSSIDEANYEETAKQEMIKAYRLTDTCDLVLELL